MKIAILVVLIGVLCVFAASAQQQEVTLSWDAYCGPADLEGFRIYQSTIEGVYTFGVDSSYVVAGAEAVELILPIPPGVSLYWVMTAFDKWGNESGPSNECSNDVIPPPVPGGLRCNQ